MNGQAHAVPMLDNAERGWYLQETTKLLEDWERRDFREGPWTTTVWERPEQ